MQPSLIIAKSRRSYRSCSRSRSRCASASSDIALSWLARTRHGSNGLRRPPDLAGAGLLLAANLKTYQGSELIGNFDSDAEGVVPKDTLVLVENGILKSLYNGRTPTRNIKGSNGHWRYKFRGGILTSDLGPGVLFITAKEGKPLDKLKKTLSRLLKKKTWIML